MTNFSINYYTMSNGFFFFFLQWQAAKLILAEGALHDPFAPATMLYKMLEGGFDVLHEPFLQEMLLKLRNHQLFKLEEKTRIYAEKSAFLKGVLDESGLLGYGQVFCRIQRKDSCRAEVIRGRVAIAKNPCLHPGDIRVLEAVDRNDLDVPGGDSPLAGRDGQLRGLPTKRKTSSSG